MINVLNQIKKLIDGMEYGTEISTEAIKLAKANNIVIMYGQSDDLLEVEGAISEEVYAYDGLGHDEDFDLGNFPIEVYNLFKDHEISLIWCPDEEKSWAFTLSGNSVFERFNIIEDGMVFSEGIILVRQGANP